MEVEFFFNSVCAAVDVFKKVLEKAGKGVKIRGFSTNVANYNPYDPPLVDPAIYRPGSFNPNWSELRYIKALAPYLRECGLPTHFIVDQGRSGAQGIRDSPTHWCNVKGAGYVPLVPLPPFPPRKIQYHLEFAPIRYI